jgi:tetratricopeptide (TPR) repeat protein
MVSDTHALSEEEWLALGRKALEAGDLLGARQLFQELVGLAPSPDLHRVIASICQEIGDLTDAVKHLQLALSLDPDFLEALSGLARLYAALGQHERALMYQGQALKRDPDRPELMADMARLLALSRNYRGALQWIDKALALAPSDPECLVTRVRVLLGDHRYAKARQQAEDLNQDHPNLAEGHIVRGWALWHLKVYDLARQSFERALSLVPDQLEALKGLGQSHLMDGDAVAAIGPLMQVKERVPGSADAILDLASAYVALRDVDAADTLLDEVWRDYDGDAVAMSRAGWMWARLGNFNKAELVLQRARGLNPQDIQVIERLGLTHLGQRSFRQARKCFIQVLKARPFSFGAVGNLCACYAYWALLMLRDGRLPVFWGAGGLEFGVRAGSARWLDLGREAFEKGNWNDAEMYFRKIRVGDVNHEVAALWLANCLIKQGAREDAVLVCRDALMHSPASAPLLALLGALCLAASREEPALTLLNKAVSLDPEHGDAWMTLGRVLQKKRQNQEAMEAFERAIALRVSDPYVYRRAGEAALALSEMTGAIRYFTVAIERNPRDIVSALRLIECLFQAGDFDGARAVAHHALSIDSNCGQAANWLETIDRARSIKEVEAQL